VKVLVDTNVVLDLLLDREPHATPAAQIFSLIERNALVGCLGATTLTTVHYLATKVVGTKKSLREIRKLLRLFEVAPINRAVLEAALETKGFRDFENAVLHEAARQADADALVTRNEKDFKKAAMAVYGPGDLISILVAQKRVED
jgi:predicted nucleic acid-binding protein